MARRRLDNITGEYTTAPLPRLHAQTYIDVRFLATVVAKFAGTHGRQKVTISEVIAGILEEYAVTPMTSVSDALGILEGLGVDISDQLKQRLGRSIAQMPTEEQSSTVQDRAEEIARGMEKEDG